MKENKIVEVVAGIIYKEDKFLIAKRNHKKMLGGLWEFPGGKVEKGETYERAIEREIKEEFNAEIKVNEYVGQEIHTYPEMQIKLLFYKAELIGEKIELLEHEDYKWITKSELNNFEFAEADKAIFEKL